MLAKKMASGPSTPPRSSSEIPRSFEKGKEEVYQSEASRKSASPPLAIPADKKDTTSPIRRVNTESKLERPRDIRFFFSATTVPRPHDDKLIWSSPGSTVRCSSPCNFPSQSRAKSHKNRHMSQLLLDISNRPTTQICKECGMSFVIGVPEDVELHKKHHKRVVEGLEWTLLQNESSQSDCRIVWRSHGKIQEEKIIKINLDPQILKKAKYKNKVTQILEMVNYSLDAQELTSEQLSASSLYVYVGSPTPPSTSQPEAKKRKLNGSTPKAKKDKLVVKAMCVAARIEQAYQIVRGPNDSKGTTDELCLNELLRFGDTTSELYCSRKAERSLIGIHRIWTSPSHRRAGLAQQLLDSVATTFIYGMPIDKVEDRLQLIAFSQPTESGMLLASKWLQTLFFKIFID